MSQSSLLSGAQRTFCQARAEQPAPNGPRAKALLALDQGNTQQQAAEQSGLSIGQVRYCLRRFRAIGQAMFDSDTETPTSSHQADRKAKKVRAGDKKGDKKTKPLKPVKPKNEKSDKKTKKKNSKSANKKGKKSDQKKDNKKTAGKKSDGKKGSKSGKKKKKK